MLPKTQDSRVYRSGHDVLDASSLQWILRDLAAGRHLPMARATSSVLSSPVRRRRSSASRRARLGPVRTGDANPAPRRGNSPALCRRHILPPRTSSTGQVRERPGLPVQLDAPVARRAVRDQHRPGTIPSTASSAGEKRPARRRRRPALPRDSSVRFRPKPHGRAPDGVAGQMDFARRIEERKPKFQW